MRESWLLAEVGSAISKIHLFIYFLLCFVFAGYSIITTARTRILSILPRRGSSLHVKFSSGQHRGTNID